MIRTYLTCEEVEIKTIGLLLLPVEAIVTDRGEDIAMVFFDSHEVEVKPDAAGEFFDLIDGHNRVTVRFRDEPRFTGDAFRMLEPDPVEKDEDDEPDPADSPYDLPMTEAERNR